MNVGRKLLGRHAVAVGLVGLTLVAAGCGSSSSGSSSTNGSSATTNSSSGSDSTPSGSTTATSASGTSTFATSANCQQLGTVGENFAKALTTKSNGSSVNLQAAASAYQQLASEAPAEIQPQLKTLANAFTQFADALTKAGYTPGSTPKASQVTAILSATKSFEQSGAVTAAKQVSAWAEKNCTT